MNVLFLGNSFTYFHDMPGIFAEISGESATMLARGGAYLHEFLDVRDPLCKASESLLQRRMPEVPAQTFLKRYGEETSLKWDYVVLQEQSFNAVGDFEDYLHIVKLLCGHIKRAGAMPVIYATWPYKDNTDKMRSTGISYDEMRKRMRENCMKAAEVCGAVFADAGEALVAAGDAAYEEDAHHTTAIGSHAAAEAIWQAIRKG